MESIIHYGIKCYECQVFPITGIRYKCIKCDSYNLCEKCEEKFGQDHGHPLLKIRNIAQSEMYNEKYNKKETKLKNPIIKKPTFVCLNSTLNFKTINNNNFINIPIKLFNNGRINWPMPCYFTCQENLSEIKGEKVKITKCSGEPGKAADFTIKIDLSKITKDGEYKSIWSLENENGESFGPKVKIKVVDAFQGKLKLKPYYLIEKIDLKNMKNNELEPITTEKLLAKKIKH